MVRFLLGALLVILSFSLSPLLAPQAHAQDAGRNGRLLSHESWVEEWNPVSREWERIDDGETSSFRRSPQPAPKPVTPYPKSNLQPIAIFGPFHVLAEDRVAISGATNARSLDDFKSMIERFPGLRVIEFHNAAGTTHDIVNLSVGREIRKQGLSTYIPPHGSARSGAVELFIAGKHRVAAPGAMFAVHSWRDERGREPWQISPNDPSHRFYVDYYMEMGMDEESSLRFYNMTNSVPHSSSLWIEAAKMTEWIDMDIAR